MPYLLLLVVIVVLVGLFVVVPRMNELFLVSVRGGEALVVRGRVPATLLHDIEDVTHRAGVERATIRAEKIPDGARLLASGVEEGVAQRLRNAFQLQPMAQLRRAPLVEDRNMGQVLGFVWLAWLLSSCRRR
jgi:hypothetical protein